MSPRLRQMLGCALMLLLALPACAEVNDAHADRSDAAPGRREPDPAPTDRSPRGGTPGEEIGSFSKARAMNHVRKLAGDIGVRVRASRRERRGIRYVARKLRKFGYEVRIQDFSVDGGRSHNVIARWPQHHSQNFVVGAHIDTVRGAPGANDNASGAAVMLENARLFAGTRQVRWLKFIAFGSEEYGTDGRHHVGSDVYVGRLGRDGRRKTAGMVSVDMIADGRPLIVGTTGIGPKRVARTLYRKLQSAGFAVDYEITCDCSDNGPFERAGIPGSFMWSGYEPNYHDDSDTVANMKPKDLLRSGRATRVFLTDVDAGMVSFFQDS